MPRRVDLADRGGRGRGLSRGVPRAGWAGFRLAGGGALIERLKAGECSKELYRKLGRYAVSVYEPHFQKLYAAGALLTAREVPALDEDSAILNDMSLYSETTGLMLEPEMGKAEFI